VSFQETVHALNYAVRSVSFCPSNPFFIATTGNDGHMKVFDLRDPYKAVFQGMSSGEPKIGVFWLTPEIDKILTLSEGEGLRANDLRTKASTSIEAETSAGTDKRRKREAIPSSLSVLRTAHRDPKSGAKLYQSATGYSSGDIDVCIFQANTLFKKKFRPQITSSAPELYSSSSSGSSSCSPGHENLIVEFPDVRQLRQPPLARTVKGLFSKKKKRKKEQQGKGGAAQKKSSLSSSPGNRKTKKKPQKQSIFSHKKERSLEDVERVLRSPRLAVSCVAWNPFPGYTWCLASATRSGIVRIQTLPYAPPSPTG